MVRCPAIATGTAVHVPSNTAEINPTKEINDSLEKITRAPLKDFPWGDFLPIGKVAASRPGAQRVSKASGFNELLDEGKKRLEKAEKEEMLRQRADVVGKMGSEVLADLLADLREPKFSRQQNE